MPIYANGLRSHKIAFPRISNVEFPSNIPCKFYLTVFVWIRSIFLTCTLGWGLIVESEMLEVFSDEFWARDWNLWGLFARFFAGICILVCIV